MKRHSLHPLMWLWVCLMLPNLGAASRYLPATLAAELPNVARQNSGKSTRKILLVHYMPWFVSEPVRGEWGKHWTGNRRQFNPETVDENGLPKLASHYHPLIGPYDSSDPDVIECHLLQMKLAGIDGVIVDWYGLAQHDDYPQSHQATQAIFSAAAKYGLKFAVCYEDRTIKRLVETGELKSEAVDSHLTETFRWLEQNWFTAPQYFRIGGRPLLLNFGPICVTSPEAWRMAFEPLQTPPRLFALNHLWKAVGADGGFTWVSPQVWKDSPPSHVIEANLRRESSRVSKVPTQTIVSAYAGFNDIYKKGYPHIAHRDGQTLKETLNACMSSSWPIIQLVTWNDFGEGTMIEPCHEFGYSLLEIVQETRRNELGSGFQYSAADLRLPEKLHQMRKSASSRVKSMDEAAELLASGEAERARQILERLSDEFSAEDLDRAGVRPQVIGSPSIQLASNTSGEDKRF